MTQRAKRVLVAVLSAMLAVILSLACVNLFVDANDDVPALKAEYAVGETVAIPEYKIDGQDAESVVIYPSGYAMKTDVVSLDEAGIYTVEYRATVSGQLKTETKTFLANRQTYSFSGNSSYYEYGVDKSQYDTGKTGLHFKIAQGETLTFEETFNIHELGGKEFINFYVTPTVKGMYDVQAFYVYVIDVNDPDNYLKIKYQAVVFGGNNYVYSAAYVLAAYNEEVLSAENGDSVRRNDRFGVGSWMSLYGNADEVNGPDQAMKNQWASLHYDPETMEVFVAHNKGKGRIIDCDDPKFFDTAWKGFSTGDVRVRIEGYSFTNSHFNFDVTSYGGVDYNNGGKAPTATVKDIEKPVITVNYDIDGDGVQDYNAYNLPKGIKGEKYSILDASATDSFDGIVEVKANAYYAYNTDSPIKLNVVDGYVETTRPGKYAIEYVATDSSGNTATEVVTFFVEDKASTLALNISGQETTGVVGLPVKLAEYEEIGVVGNSNVTLSFDTENIRLNKKTNTFIPLQSGDIKVTYTLIDFTGKEVEKIYTVAIENNPNPVVLENVNINEYVVSEQKYIFPTVNAFDFNQNKEVKTDIYVEGVKLTGGAYIPSEETAGQAVAVEYKVGSVVVYTTEVKVVDTHAWYCYSCDKIVDEADVVKYKHQEMVLKDGKTELEKCNGAANTRIMFNEYWVGEDITTSANKNGVYINANNTGDVAFSYLKPIMLEKFSLNVAINKTNFSALDIKLIDCDNEDNVFTMSMVKGDDVTNFVVNGVLQSGNFWESGFFVNGEAVFAYTAGKMSAENLSYTISKDFSAKKVYVELTMKNVTGEAGVCITNAFGQPTTIRSNTATDRQSPIATYYGSIPGIVYLNDALTIPALVAEDVLDPCLVNTLTVTAPDGSIAYKGSIDKDVTIKLTQYGRYSINYTSIDTSGKSTGLDEYVTCLNTTKPVITVSGEVTKSIKLGGVITLPSATATDDVDETVEVKYFIVESTGTIRLLDQTRKFKPTRAGRYTARYYAVDSSGNATIVDYIFVVGG